MDRTEFKKCRFTNILGNEEEGIVRQGFSGHIYPMDVDFINCTFDNTSFCKGGKKNNSNFRFYNCQLNNGCKIYNLGKTPISFEDSKLTDVGSYVNQSGSFSFENCSIIQKDKTVKYPLLLFGTHTMKNCEVVDQVGVSNYSKQRGVKAYKIKSTRQQLMVNFQ
jgi:hypothetical protein